MHIAISRVRTAGLFLTLCRRLGRLGAIDVSTHFAELLDQLHRRCLNMGSLAQTSVKRAVDALLARNAGAAQLALDSEREVDHEEVEIEKQAINLIALHQPAAGDLRTVLAIVKINGDLERIADCAVNVAVQVPAYTASGLSLPAELRTMAESVLKQLDDTLRALGNRDAGLAEQIARSDEAIDALYNQVVQELQRAMSANPQHVPGGLALVLVARNLERIGDHCTNIAEDVLYRMRGRIVRHTHDPR